MKSIIIFATTFSIAAVSAMQSFEIPHPHIPPGPTDFRSPCPALNTLANHGYLPRNGSHWKAADVISALTDVYNLEPSLSSTLAWGAVFLVGNTLTQSFSLGDFSGWQEVVEGAGLSRHNRIEHDASLTRLDAQSGDNWSFNAGLYKELQDLAEKLNGSDFNTDVMSAHRYNRYQDSKAKNPSFTFGPSQQLFAYTEAAIALLGLGGQNGTAAAATFDSFFIHEQIPDNFVKNPVPISGNTVMIISREIYNKNPVPSGVVNFLHGVHDLECLFANTFHAMLPDVASPLINYISKNTGISWRTNC